MKVPRILVTAGFTVGLVAFTLTQQGPPAKLPAAAQPPGQDRAQQDEPGPPESAVARGNVPERLRELTAGQRGAEGKGRAQGQERAANQRLQAASAAPPGLEQDQGPPEPPSNRRMTPDVLRQRLEELPGGAQMIEAAKQRGARISAADAMPQPLLGSLNPFAWLAGPAQTPFAISVSAATPYVSGGYLYRYGSMQYTSNSYFYLNNLTVEETSLTAPYAQLRVVIPADGWYYINFYGGTYTGSQVQLQHYNSGKGWNPIGQLKAGLYGADQPTLLELSAGTHYFKYVNLQGNAWVYAIEAYAAG